jgi:protein-S-isoprenylcysteine O-methyltransferase Ste14
MNGIFNTPDVKWIGTMWGIWLVYWFISAIGVKSTRQRASPAERWSYVIPTLLGVVLMGKNRFNGRTEWLATQVIPYSDDTVRLAVALVTLGLGFSIWARWHLGRNWSASVTVKEDHELIRSGPYAWVRHPIYTGMLAAGIGTAIAIGELHAFIGLAITTVGFIRKLRIEEQWMREVFGEQYAKYAEEVSALIPYVF